MDYLHDQMRARGWDIASLCTRASNQAARRLYARHGYRQTADVTAPDGRDEIVRYELRLCVKSANARSGSSGLAAGLGPLGLGGDQLGRDQRAGPEVCQRGGEIDRRDPSEAPNSTITDGPALSARAWSTSPTSEAFAGGASTASAARSLRSCWRCLAATAIADFRDLSGVPGEFDVVVCCDNAIPHLLDAAEIDVALTEMHNTLRPGGLLVVSTRDYERGLAERPRTAPPLDMPGPPRRIVVRLHEWDAADSSL